VIRTTADAANRCGRVRGRTPATSAGSRIRAQARASTARLRTEQLGARGFGLFSSGRYAITQLPSGSTLSWGGGGPGDLQAVDVFVSDELLPLTLEPPKVW
jgi:hypothetical protein